MASVHHSTSKPVELSSKTVAAVAKTHRDTLVHFSKDEDRESTGNARSAVTKPATIPAWAK